MTKFKINNLFSSEISFDEKICRANSILFLATDCSDCACDHNDCDCGSDDCDCDCSV